MKKLIFVGIVLIVILAVMIIMLPSYCKAQDGTNDSWYDTRWGGDTGEETFVEPNEEEPTRTDDDGGELCSGIIKTGGFIFGLAFCMAVYNDKITLYGGKKKDEGNN